MGNFPDVTRGHGKLCPQERTSEVSSLFHYCYAYTLMCTLMYEQQKLTLAGTLKATPGILLN